MASLLTIVLKRASRRATAGVAVANAAASIHARGYYAGASASAGGRTLANRQFWPIGAPVASSGSAAVANFRAGGRREFCSGGEKDKDDFRSKCMKYLVKVWKYYSTTVAVTFDHINRVATFIGIAVAVVCTLFALDQRDLDAIGKDVKELLNGMEELTQIVNNGMESLTKFMTEMRDKLEIQEEKGGKNEGGDKPEK